jgi:hypothetical protein
MAGFSYTVSMGLVDRADFGFWILDFRLFFGERNNANIDNLRSIQNPKSKIQNRLPL